MRADTIATPLTLPLDRDAIERILPHRYPFLFVDEIVELEPDRRIVGIKRVTHDEPWLTSTSRHRRALPSLLLMEAVAQVGAIMVLAKAENRGRLIFFMGTRTVHFRRPVYAGDVVSIEAVVRLLRTRSGLFHGRARVDGRVVAHGAMTFALGPAGDARETERVEP